MGCDIHLLLERRTPTGWVTVDTMGSHHSRWRQDNPMDGWSSPIATDRNYRRFAALAGVRGPGPGPRGMPVDASQTATYLAKKYGDDGHNHSWMLVSEALPIFVKTHFWPEKMPEDSWARKYPESYFFNIEGGDLSDYRLVFWFDN